MNTVLAGRYHLVQALGSGGFGQTFIATDSHLPSQPTCVVKQLKPSSSDPEFLQVAKRLFDLEAVTLYRLGKHDQIPQLLAHFQQDGEFYLVQEYIKGQPLNQELASRKRLNQPESVALLQDILQVLAFVHAQKVIHRDIKPSNLIRRKSDCKIVLIDFGAVKEVNVQTASRLGQTNFTVAIGSPGYMPVEQRLSQPRFSSDIYAVGMVILEALTGISPRELPVDDQTHEFRWGLLSDRISLNPGFAALLERMVHYDHRQRFQNASEALQALTVLSNSGELEQTTTVLSATTLPCPDATSPDAAELFHQSQTQPPGEPQDLATSKQKSMMHSASTRVVRQDWGEAVDVSTFYGRSAELVTLIHWMMGNAAGKQSNCRLVALLGMGGIGKTTLAIHCAEQIQSEFEYLVWRSLRNAPPLQTILINLIQVLSNEREIHPAATLDDSLSQLITYLRQHRCLLILDNFDAILGSGECAGHYRPGYEGYGELLRRVGEERHQSCLMLTSREKPAEVAFLEGETLPVRTLQLAGLKEAEGQEILRAKGLSGTDAERRQLIACYSGNPLALKIVATSIRDLFDGDIAQFLAEGTAVFNGIRILLDQQLSRLSDLEKQVMVWLAINRELVSIAELQSDIFPLGSKIKLLEALESLRRRCLIETAPRSLTEKSVAGSTQQAGFIQQTGFTQQPVVMEYMTEQLIEHAYQEIVQQQPVLLKRYALLKAQAKDYVRETQARLILQPTISRLLSTLGTKETIEHYLSQILAQQHLQGSLDEKSASLAAAAPLEPGYVGGNVLNLFRELNTDLSGRDFSHLVIWQAYLADVSLRRVNFAASDLSKSVFAETLGIVLMVAFSPDGNLLAMGDTNGAIRIWQVASGQPLLTQQAHNGWTFSIAFSPDSQFLASSGTEKIVKLWNVYSGKCLKVLRGHTGTIVSVTYSPNGEVLASASDDHTIKLWNMQTGQCSKTLQGHTDRVFSVSFSPDGKLLASGSDDQTVKLWDVQTGQGLRTLHGHEGTVPSVCFSPMLETSPLKPKYLLASSGFDRMLKLWNTDTGQCLNTFHGHLDQVWSMAFSPDGKLLASGSNDQTAKIWDVETGQCLKTLQGHTNWLCSVAFAPQRDASNPSGQMLVSGSYDQSIRLWDIQTGQCLKTIQGHTDQIRSIAFNSSGQFLASGGTSPTVRIWDVHTGQCVNILQGHANVVMSVAFSPDDQLLASGSFDQTIKIWDARTGHCFNTLHGHASWVFSVAFSPDGKTLASSGFDGIKLWDVQTGQYLNSLQGHTNSIFSIAFSPDGKTLASGSFDHTIKLWDFNTGQCLNTLQGHTGWVMKVDFSPDGRTLASSSFDHTIKLWDLDTGQCLNTLLGHTDQIVSVAFSPDGKLLASGSDDQTIKLWDVQTGQCLETLQGHTNWVLPVTFAPQCEGNSPDGLTLASGSADETIKLWDIKTGTCLRTMRADRPYEGLNITGVIGLTAAQKITLKALGAVDQSFIVDSQRV